MKREYSNLLDELVQPARTKIGPSSSEVLTMVRQEHYRRRKRRLLTTVSLSIVVAMTSIFLLQQTARESKLPLNSSRATFLIDSGEGSGTSLEQTRLVMEEVNDDQLLDSLDQAPSALLEWPNGERTLLVLK
jgi:hypothetical protein